MKLLVDDGWKLVEIEPGSVEVNGNGNGDHHAIGPTVELVPGNGHVPSNCNSDNGNGHYDGDPKPQQSLFSWAEFMAVEQVIPKGRRYKPQTGTLSMFEWALALEQKRNVEPVGSGY